MEGRRDGYTLLEILLWEAGRVYTPRDSPVVVGQLYTPQDSQGEAWGGGGRFSWGRGGYKLFEILLAVFIVLYVSLCTLSIFSSHPSQGNTPGDHEWVSVISSLSRLGDIGEHFDFKLHLTLIRILF